MPEDTELENAKVRLKANGDLIQRTGGSEVIVAHYDRKTGHLEFATKKYSQDLYNQVTARLGSDNGGTQPSNLVIRSITVKGEAPSPKATTKRPKMGKEGDGTPAVVDWYIKNALSEAITRYGIYTDATGKPVRKHVQRIIPVMVDGRNEPSEPAPTPIKGQSHDGGPVQIKKSVIQVRNAIIARRATRYEDNPDILEELGVEKLEALFNPNEVIGGFQPDEDFEDAVVGGEAEVES